MMSGTATAWGPGLQHPVYATEDTYRLAAAWLTDCATVEDWGGGSGHLAAYLPDAVAYCVVEGTRQGTSQVLADLAHYRGSADGIVLRHVLDVTENWQAVLVNALASFQRRMVVVTFTPDAEQTRVAKMKSGWPVRHFSPEDLRQHMAPWLVSDEAVSTTHPERIYFCRRA